MFGGAGSIYLGPARPGSALQEPYHKEEFAFLQGLAEADLKIPITGAYTLADWSFDEHYFTAWLGHAHGEMDRQVLVAYGWPVDIGDDELLRRLLELNAKRASEESLSGAGA